MGFDASHVLTAAVAPPRTQYRDPAALRQLYTLLLERAGALPGVRSAGLTNMLPLSGGEFALSFQIEGRPPAATPGGEPVAGARVVSPSYVSTMGMRLLQGRDLSPLDGESAPGAILVNETMARRYWPGGSPLGARILLNDLEATVVGVVGDVHHRGPGSSPGAELYVPFQQFNARQAILVLRTTGDASRTAAALRAVMRDVDPALPLSNVAGMETLVERSVAQPRFLAVLLTGFAALAALLALVGVYGLLSFSISRRARELGLRMALGAGRARVVALVLAQSGWLVGVGLAIGAALAVALSRVMRTLLFGVGPGDPVTVALMAAGIAAAALAASLPPAFRAAGIDPVVVLRDE
jgi:predicted permease